MATEYSARHQRRWPSISTTFFATSIIIVVSSIPRSKASLPLNQCSQWNTAGTSANYSIYQTNGLCHDFCVGKYAWAIDNYQSCWCSNYSPDPSTLVSLDECNTPCPGYPADMCGGPNLFGYIALGMAPAGTRGSSVPLTTIAPITTTAPVTSARTSSSSSIPISLAPSVETVTQDGVIQTVTVTPTLPAGLQGSGNDSKSSAGLSSGQIAGLVVGVVAIIVFIIALLVWILLKRLRRNEMPDEDSRSPRHTPGGIAGSRLNLPAMTDAGLVAGSTNDMGRSASADRLSRLEVDPRMDPFKGGLYERNQSHESLNTLRDDHDYSRRVHQPRILRALNPDPTNE